jgi:lactoylglutathione lyase
LTITISDRTIIPAGFDRGKSAPRVLCPFLEHEGDGPVRLNHANLTVPDGLRCVTEKGRNALAVLVDETGFVLTLNNFERVAAVEYPGAFHIGFMQDSREKVDAIFERLKAGGFDIQPPREFHGAWTFYLNAPGGFSLEVGYQHKWL